MKERHSTAVAMDCEVPVHAIRTTSFEAAIRRMTNESPASPQDTVDIVLPVLNEEHRLTRGVVETVRYCREHAFSFRVTIADNGSTDRTRDVARELESLYPEVRYLSVGERGVGRALKKAWRESECSVVGYMDVDLATDLKHLDDVRAVFRSQRGDLLVSGSRLLPGSRVINRTITREISSRGFNLLLRWILGVKFSDGMCGFKFLRKSTFERLMRSGVRNDDWFFNTEIMVISEWLTVPVREIPVRWVDDRDSRVRVPDLARKYLREMARLRRHRKTVPAAGGASP